MIRFPRCLLAALLLAAAPLPPAGSATAATGTTFSRVLTIEEKQVPLPEGTWELAGDRVDDEGTNHQVLVQVVDGAVSGVVMAQASTRHAPAAWGTAPGCRRVDLPFARIRYASDHDGSCAYIATVLAGHHGAMDPAWVEALSTADERGWPMPERWAVVVIRVSDRLGAVQVRYAFPLTDDGELLALLPAWAATAWDGVELGLLNRLDPAQVLNRPAVAASSSGEQPDGGFSVPQAVWKTLSFRAIVSTFDFTSNRIAIGNLATATLLSAWNTLTGPWVYLAHELAWDYFGSPAAGDEREIPGLGDEEGLVP